MATASAPLPDPAAAAAPGPSPAYRVPLAVLTTLFFLWGFITCLNDILIPHLKAAFALSFTQAALIQLSFFTAYALTSLPAGALVKRVGYQRGIVVGLLIAGAGCLLFYPAASTRLYPLFLGALFVLAAGITLLQVSANPFVTLLGPAATASSRLNLTQAFNSLGTTLAPYFGAALMLSRPTRGEAEVARLSPAEFAAYRAGEAASVQVPYVILALVLAAIALLFALWRLPRLATDAPGGGSYRATLGHRHLALGAVGIFVYVGAEVSIGSFLVNFFQQPEVAGLAEQAGSRYLPLYWGGAMLGRFLGSAVMQRAQPGQVLSLAAICAAGLATLTLLLDGQAAMYAILSVGLFNSIMFPTIFSLALAGLGDDTPRGAGVLCVAIAGGAIVPVAFGAVADAVGLHHAFFVPALCYLYIAWYGARGARPGPAR